MEAVSVLEKPVAEWDWRQRVIEIILAAPEPPAKRKMTYEEFLAWADEDTLAEWVDGEVVMTSPASYRHQDVRGFLEAVLRPFVEERKLGIVQSAPFQMKLPGSGREPDLFFVAARRLDRLRRTYLDGPADLAVEVLSPESIGRDRGEKFYEYAGGGVSEYWLIDPDAQWAEFYRLGEFGLYEQAFAGREGLYRSATIPGFWLRVEWLWQEPLPAVDETLLEIGGATYARRQIALIRERGLWPPEDAEG
jgi:Uma2 family endonuclease